MLFPAWYLGRNPDKKMITASYIGSLPGQFAGQVRDIMEGKAYQLIFPAVKIAGRARGGWGIVGRKGGLMATGVTSSLTGWGADIMIIDDPIRDAMFADSPTWRDHLWDWFASTAYTRLHPGAPVFLIATRWHFDDLTGRLQKAHEIDPEAAKWNEVFFEAVDKDGKALWPERYDEKAMRQIKATVGTRVWNALYQGRPTPDEGGLFKRWMFRKVLKALPVDKKYRLCRYWDKAGTDGGGDYTVGALMAIDEDKRLYLVHVVRGQWSALEREQIIEATAKQDIGRYGELGRYTVAIEQEPGSGGKESAEGTIRRLAGFRVKADKPEGQLTTRADPLAAQMEAGNVYLVEGAWIEPLIDEFCQFPLGEHDDQIAGACGAFKMLTGIKAFRYELL